MAKPNHHDARRVNHGELNRLVYALGLARAVIVPDYGHHAVVEAEDGHEDEALELEVDAEDGGRPCS